MATWKITFATETGETRRDRVKGSDEAEAAKAFMMINPNAMIQKIEITIG